MRDIAVTLIILGFVPVILKYPWTGVLVYAWVSLFSLHRFAWGFAYDFPFAMVIGVATAVAMLLHWKEVQFPINSITILLMLLPLWMTVTLFFAIEPTPAYVRWKEVMKTFVFLLVTASLLRSRKQLEALLWVIALSIGFYGMKGGIFTMLVGGEHRVYGPPGQSYISDNTAIAVALIMTLPLMHYLSITVSSKWIKWGLYGAMLLSGIAILGTHSRGGFLAILVMFAFLWLNSNKKVLFGTFVLLVGVIFISFMPEQWMSRMDSIGSYEKDESALGRLNTWQMAFNLANDRPLVGGGFELYEKTAFAKYAPNPTDIHSSHNVVIQMLGEHGYVGLALFLLLATVSWVTARRIVKASRNCPDYAWAGNLARAIQGSLIGFAAGGMFVNIAYWNVVYYLVVILMASYRLAPPLELKPGRGVLESKPYSAVT